MATIALTTDIGEGFGRWELADDAALLDVVTSANIACGFHGGDPSTMRNTCQISVDNGVSIGAQVSYRDLHGFGRRYIAASRTELADDLLYQMGALEAFARLAGSRVEFIRAHGALYNASATVPEHAQAIVDATKAFNPDLPLLCQVDTETWRLGKAAGLRTVAEAFVDRAYTPEGLLVPRSEPNAMFKDPQEAANRAVALATGDHITAIDGTRIKVDAEALLVHCDTDGAVDIAKSTRQALEQAGVELIPLR